MAFLARPGTAMVVITCVLGFWSAGARAQFVPQPPQYNTQPRANTITSTQVPVQPSGYLAPQAYPGYYPGYGPIQYNGPAGGYLTGASNVISSQADFMKSRVQSDQMREQVKQAKIDTRRKSFDNWMYEREMTPTLEEERERERQREYQRSRNNPPLTEIWSAKALNDLLLVLQQKQSVPGPTVPLDQEMLRHINVTSGAGQFGVGLIKPGGHLEWPLALDDKPYQAECQQIEKTLADALSKAASGTLPAQDIRRMTTSIDRLMALLKQNIEQVSANDYITAKRYLNELNQSIKVLSTPNAAKYLTGQFAARGNNVQELVTQMTSQGIRFGPATAGDQEAYTALHSAMVAYDSGINQLVASRQPPSNKQ